MIHLPIFPKHLGQFAFEEDQLSLEQAKCIATRDADSRVWSCNECVYLGSESDGGEPEYATSWPVCRKEGHERYEHLKNFPFKRAPERCFELDFWASIYARAADLGNLANFDDDAAFRAWRDADRFGRPAGERAVAS